MGEAAREVGASWVRREKDEVQETRHSIFQLTSVASVARLGTLGAHEIVLLAEALRHPLLAIRHQVTAGGGHSRCEGNRGIASCSH